MAHLLGSVLLALTSACPADEEEDDEAGDSTPTGTETGGATSSSTGTGDAVTGGSVVDCGECGRDPLCHNAQLDGVCFCDVGYEFEDETPGSFRCVRIPPRPQGPGCVEPNSHQVGDQCFCADGFNWCSDDLADLSCCEDENQDSLG